MGLFHTQVRTALFSPDRRYRYRLTTVWDKEKPVLIGLFCNPSIADEKREDNTDRIFRVRAKELGYGGACLINLFALIGTNPACIKESTDPIGRENDHHILMACREHKDVFCGWGIHGAYMQRGTHVIAMIRKHLGDRNTFYYLKATKDGHPNHPLYIKKTTPLMVWAV